MRHEGNYVALRENDLRKRSYQLVRRTFVYIVTRLGFLLKICRIQKSNFLLLLFFSSNILLQSFSFIVYFILVNGLN